MSDRLWLGFPIAAGVLLFGMAAYLELDKMLRRWRLERRRRARGGYIGRGA